MTKNNGNIPCFKDNSNVIHITISGTKCLCGKSWEYGIVNRIGNTNNILFRNINAISCKECKKLYKNI